MSLRGIIDALPRRKTGDSNEYPPTCGCGYNRRMRVLDRNLLLVIGAMLCGCASAVRPDPVNPFRYGASAPSEDPTSMLALAAIPPAPLLHPAIPPSSRPSVAALILFAQGRDLMVKSQPVQAIDLLHQAIGIDPGRFDLQNELGLAYLAAGGMDNNAAAAFEKAAAIDPNHLYLQTELGRLYLDKGDLEKALSHLRLALLTDEYSDDYGEAAAADYLLADVLQRMGYDRASLDQYLLVLHRLENPTSELRENGELGYLLQRPEALYIHVGELLEKHAEYDQAVKAFEPAAEREPENLDLQARIARDLARLGRRDEALQKAVDLIVKDRASAMSLGVLRDVCGTLNIHKGEIAELQKLVRRRPTDQAVLFALTDTLIADNRLGEAVQLLESAWQKTSGDLQIARRLLAIYRQSNAITSAAPLLVGTLSRNADALHILIPLWTELFQTGQENRLTLQTAAEVWVPADQQPAKLLLIGLEALNEDRPALARVALQQASQAKPIFAPAERGWLSFTWQRPELTDAQKKQLCNQRVLTLKNEGYASLAEELRGRSLLLQEKPTEAAAAFASATALGGQSPDLQLINVKSGRKNGHDAVYEQLLWTLVSDFPFFEDGYLALLEYYADAATASREMSAKVLSTWLVNDPQNVIARVSQARLDARLGNSREAEQELLHLLDEDPDNNDTYIGLQLYFTEINRVDKLITKLEEMRAARPKDTEIVARLVELYVGQKRTSEAVRLVDATRTAVGTDADLLYSLTSLYSSLGQQQSTEDLLEQILQIDPTYAGASNDLGFIWADHGKNLSQSEDLTRAAVAAEPDNPAFLDSLGWVLYKRGRFEDARKQLEKATGSAVPADPAMLDHLGDALYRLSRTDDARQTWQRSLAGLNAQATGRDDLSQLRLQLLQKIKQVETKKPVDVAPFQGAGATAVAGSNHG